jgi:hypothetical protein
MLREQWRRVWVASNKERTGAIGCVDPKLIIIHKTLNNFHQILPRCPAGGSNFQDLVKDYAPISVTEIIHFI